MIPKHIAVTYCRACECSIETGGLCSYGCQWDATTNVHERPILVKTYWLREERLVCATHAKSGVPCNNSGPNCQVETRYL